jgi:hypothetical protein
MVCTSGGAGANNGHFDSICGFAYQGMLQYLPQITKPYIVVTSANEIGLAVTDNEHIQTEAISQDAVSRQLESGVSAELHGLFQSLQESPGRYGPKFSAREVALLRQHIVCRNYARLTLELGYLCQGIVQHGSHTTKTAEARLLKFFYQDECLSGAKVRQFFQLQPSQTVIEITPSFAISPGRVQFLALFLEFCLFLDGRVLQRLGVSPANSDVTAIDQQSKQAARDLQKTIYDFLAEHLPAVQLQRQYRAIRQWLTDEGRLWQHEICDDSIVAFWQAMCAQSDEGLGFRRFRSVAGLMLDLQQCLLAGRDKQQHDYAASIGYDVEQGEWSPEQLQQTLDSLQLIDVEALSQPAKLLTASQLEQLEPLLQAGNLASQFPLTVCRSRWWGDAQAVLVQACRNADKSVLLDKLADLTPWPLEQWPASFTDIDANISQVKDCLGHIFVVYQDPLALGMLAQSSLEWQQWQQIYREGWLALCQEPSFASACQRVQQAFKGLNRQGFKQLPLADELVDYEYGWQQLQALAALITRHRAAFKLQLVGSNQTLAADNPHFASAIAAKNAADFAIAKQVFDLLYGSTHD